MSLVSFMLSEHTVSTMDIIKHTNCTKVLVESDVNA